MVTMLDIRGIDKAELLTALVNRARPLGLGQLADPGAPMTVGEAREWIARGQSHDDPRMLAVRGPTRLRFDYVHGRPIKCDISGDELDPRLYDQDQGDGAAAAVVEHLRSLDGVAF
jgi:hypothetical protein